ncbi:MAG: DUF3293 domain-containing protein [Acidimicrobiia bacterium]
MDSDDELWDLYADAVIECRIDHHTRCLRGPNADPLPDDAPMFVLTAHNPQGVTRDQAVNDEAERGLERDLALIGVTCWSATGRSRNASWSEPGVAVGGFDRARACELGRRYGQLAVFELTADDVHVVRCIDTAVVRTRRRGD